MQIRYILLSLCLSLCFEISSRIVIDNATLIDAESPTRINMTLVLQEDEIVYIGKTRLKEIPLANQAPKLCPELPSKSIFIVSFGRPL